MTLPPDTRRPLPGGEVRAVLLMAAALLCLPVLLMLAIQYIDSHENVASQCMYSQPAGVAKVNDPLVTASTTAMPAGRLCVYLAEGGGEIVVQTGWPTTVFGLAATAAIAVLTLFALGVRHGRGVVVTLLPAIVALGLWAMVLLSAHTAH